MGGALLPSEREEGLVSVMAAVVTESKDAAVSLRDPWLLEVVRNVAELH